MVDASKQNYINKLVEECLSEDGEALELKGKFVGDEGLACLVQVDGILEEIENLDLAKNFITHKGILHIAECKRFKKLKRLYLGDNTLGDKGAIALAKASFLENLAHLDLKFNDIWSLGGMAIVKSRQFKKLQVLILQENNIGDDVASIWLNPPPLQICGS